MSARREADKQRAARLAADRQLALELTRKYTTTWRRIQAKLDRLVRDINAAKARGETVDAGWLAQHAGTRELNDATRSELAVYAQQVDKIIADGKQAAVVDGAADSHNMIRASLPRGMRWKPNLPVRAIAEIAARVESPTPLGQLLAHYGVDAAAAARDKLVAGVATGTNPRLVARQIREHLAGNQVRALRVARTETMGAYRRAASAGYRDNSDVVTGWVWIAELSTTTCAVCLEMHGSQHTLDEDLDSHPSCRCTQAPITVPWADLGFPDLAETSIAGTVEPGRDWFARQPRATQLQVLGPGKLAAYQDGTLELADLVEPTVHPVWGRGLRERPLRDLQHV